MSDDERLASEVISASLGGAISAAVLYPLEVLKTKLQAETKPPPPLSSSSSSSTNNKNNKKNKTPSWTMWQYAKHVGATEGYGVFVDGFETSAFQSAMEKALYFFAYTMLKQLWRRFHQHQNQNHHQNQNQNHHQSLNTLTTLLLGCCAEWCHLPITLPLDCWTTYIQTQSKQDGNNNKSHHGPLAMFLALLSEKGWAGLYKGWQAYYVLCFKPALQYTVFEQVKAMVLKQRRLLRYQQQQQQLQLLYTTTPSSTTTSSSSSLSTSLGAMESFFLGMFARVVATVLVFPYVRAKVVLQTQKTTTMTTAEATATTTTTTSSDNNDTITTVTNSFSPLPPPPSTTTTTSIPQMLWTMYQEQGLASWFQGIGPELTRGMLSAALMLMIKEQLYAIVDNALYGTGIAASAAGSKITTTTPTTLTPPRQPQEQAKRT